MDPHDIKIGHVQPQQPARPVETERIIRTPTPPEWAAPQQTGILAPKPKGR